jgi:hypothetical protein
LSTRSPVERDEAPVQRATRPLIPPEIDPKGVVMPGTCEIPDKKKEVIAS